MNYSKVLIASLFLVFFFVSADEVPTTVEMKQQCESRGMTWNNWCNPEIVLDSRLSKSIDISNCKATSGLTCKLTLLASSKLPSQIFVQPQDSHNNSIGKEFRLIYPNLTKNNWHSGVATFKGFDVSATKLYLRGEWNKEYESAY